MNTIKPKLRIAGIIVTLASSVPGLSAGERQDSLQAALKGADRVTVIDVEPGRQAEPNKGFDFGEADKIAELVSSLDFDDDESGFRCMCLGDATVTFFRGGEKIAELSHHHGHSLRWNDGTWDGDSLFTEKAARAWREWFNAQGEARFEKCTSRPWPKQSVNGRFTIASCGHSDLRLVRFSKPQPGRTDGLPFCRADPPGQTKTRFRDPPGISLRCILIGKGWRQLWRGHLAA
jgi:hypothetical protein